MEGDSNFRIDMITQDAEPQPVARTIGYYETYEEASAEVQNLLKDPDRDCYYAIYDLNRESYIE